MDIRLQNLRQLAKLSPNTKFACKGHDVIVLQPPPFLALLDYYNRWSETRASNMAWLDAFKNKIESALAFGDLLGLHDRALLATQLRETANGVKTLASTYDGDDSVKRTVDDVVEAFERLADGVLSRSSAPSAGASANASAAAHLSVATSSTAEASAAVRDTDADVFFERRLACFARGTPPLPPSPSAGRPRGISTSSGPGCSAFPESDFAPSGRPKSAGKFPPTAHSPLCAPTKVQVDDPSSAARSGADGRPSPTGPATGSPKDEGGFDGCGSPPVYGGPVPVPGGVFSLRMNSVIANTGAAAVDAVVDGEDVTHYIPASFGPDDESYWGSDSEEPVYPSSPEWSDATIPGHLLFESAHQRRLQSSPQPQWMN